MGLRVRPFSDPLTACSHRLPSTGLRTAHSAGSGCPAMLQATRRGGPCVTLGSTAVCHLHRQLQLGVLAVPGMEAHRGVCHTR